MHPDIVTARQLQKLDIRIGELRAEIAQLPKHIAAIEKQLDVHLHRLEMDKAALAANLRERKKMDADNQTEQQKISRLRDQMMSAKTNDQYRAFQHEITFAEELIRKSEDKILDRMGESEGLEKNVQAAETALKQEKSEVEAQKRDAQLRTAADKQELAAALAERQKLAAALAKPVLTAYERQRKRNANGVAIAEVVDGLCTACFLALRPQHFQDVRRGDEVLYCENCKRIIFYTPPATNVAAEMQP